MIEALPATTGVPKAKVICDVCGKDEVVPCDYERRASGAWEVREGQALNKVYHRGWASVGNKLHCSICAAARRAARPTAKRLKEEKPDLVALAADPPPLREATPEQNFEIAKMLEATYDRGAKRYTGGDTDQTVADAVGEGVLPGWVARIRESMFGPDGGNAEMEELGLAIAEAITRLDAHDQALAAKIDGLIGLQKEAADAKAELNAMAKRLASIRAAVGPRVAR